MRSEFELKIKIQEFRKKLKEATNANDQEAIKYCKEQLRQLEVELKDIECEKQDRDKGSEMTM